MKILRKTVIIIFCIKISLINAQVNFEINQSWDRLNENLIIKAEISLGLVNEIKNSSKINKTILKNTESSATELKTLCKNKYLDRSGVQLIYKKNKELNVFLTNLMVSMEKDFSLISREEILRIFDELAAIENQIYSEGMKFNENCLKYDNKNLIFDD
jgi:hypothetical protein